MYQHTDDTHFAEHLDRLLALSDDENDVDPRHAPDVVITPQTLVRGIATANEYLSAGNICKPIPQGDGEDALASALTAVIRLSRCCQANVNLREQADKRASDIQRSNEQLSKKLSAAKERLSQKQTALKSLQTTAQQAESKHQRAITRLQNENTDLKQRLTNASHREHHLSQQARRHQKDYGHLQSRVHAIIRANTLSFEPTITLVGHRNDEDTEEELDEEEDARILLDAENDKWRLLLRAVMEEIDDVLIVSCPPEKLQDMPPAPSAEQMGLPFHLLEEDLETGLETKFQLLRDTLGGKV